MLAVGTRIRVKEVLSECILFDVGMAMFLSKALDPSLLQSDGRTFLCSDANVDSACNSMSCT